jgi:AcrR family transcriptional regulator
MRIQREKTEVRQEQIKKALLEIIAEEGLQNISTRNLATRIGLSEGAIFKHFSTKKDIIYGIMEDVEKDLLAKLRKISLSSLDAETKLFNYLCANVLYLRENRGVTILLFSEATHLGDKHLKEKLSQILYQQKQFIIKIIKDGIADGVWNKEIEPEDFAMIYMGIPTSFNIDYILNKNYKDDSDFCQRMYKIILNALR